MIIERIHSYLNEPKDISPLLLAEVCSLSANSFNRQFGAKEESERTLRLSSIGQCLRKQAYNILGFEHNGKAIDARAKMVFFQGDMAEMAIIQLALLAGCKITNCGMAQQEVDILGVKGHPDGILETDLENYLVEVKSMSSYSFADFEAGSIDEGYLYQINAYLYALGMDKCIVIALNKDAGVLSERIIVANEYMQSNIHNNITLLKAATKENLPDRKFKPNEKGLYPFNCLYCAYHYTCLPNAERVLLGKSYKLKEKEVKNA